MFVASQNKLLQSYVDQTVTITKSFQPHLPLYVATVDGRGGESGMGQVNREFAIAIICNADPAHP